MKVLKVRIKVLRGSGIGYWHQGFVLHSVGDLISTNTFWVSGGSGAFKSRIWNKLGGLDILFNPFYWEDIDLSYRAMKSGYKLIFEKNSVVIHEHEEGVIKSKFKPKNVQKIVYRNQFFFVWKNITDKKLLLSHLLWLPYHFLTAIVRKDWIFLQGFLLALLQLNRVQIHVIKLKNYSQKRMQRF